MNSRQALTYLTLFCQVSLLASLSFRFSEWQRLSLYATAVTFVLDYVVNQRWQGWHPQKCFGVYMLMLLVGLLPLVRQLFDATPPTADFLSQMGVRSAFLAVGVIGLLGGSIIRLHTAACTMVVSSVVVIAISLILYARHIPVPADYITADGGYYNDMLHYCIGSHMQLDLYMNMAVVLGLFTLEKAPRRVWKILLLAGVACISVKVLLSDGRTGFFAQAFILLAYVGRYFWQHHRSWLLPSGAVVALIIVLFAGVNPKLHSLTAITAHNARPALWKVAWEMGKEKPMAGYGLSSAGVTYVHRAQTDSAVISDYLEPERYTLTVLNDPDSFSTFSPHSAWLQTWLETGLLGVVCLVLFFLYIPVAAPREVLLPCLLLVLISAWQLVFDTFSPEVNPLLIGLLVLVLLQDSVHVGSPRTAACTSAHKQ